MTGQPEGPTDLVHASHVRLAYRAMLGRDATDEEVRVQLAGLRTTGELLHVLAASPEFQGTARVMLDPKPGPSLANIWHPDLSRWTHQAGTVSADEVAVIGEDGWIFIQGGSNSAVAQFNGAHELPADWERGWAELMAKRAAAVSDAGITWVPIVVPDKLAVEGDHLHTPLSPQGPRPMERLLGELKLPILYPLDELRAARSEKPVYLKTDSHYSLHGNYVAHKALAEAIGVEPLDEAELATKTAYVSSGDLGSRFDPPIVELMDSMLGFGAATVIADNRDQVAANGGHIGSRRVFQNEQAGDPRTVVLFGDSYGFCGHGYEGLSWFMAQLFREVHFIWTPFGWDAGYAERAGAEIVISQTAERFITRVPALSLDTDELVRRASAEPGAVSPELVFADPR